jgi:phosphate/sulfate permease
MPDQKPFTYQYIFDRWADGLKVLGAGNGTGLIAAGASVQYLTSKPELVIFLKIGASLFLLGVILFAVAYLIVTILPLAILHFVEESDKTYITFREMIVAYTESKKTEKTVYLALVALSILSFICFIVGCALANHIVMNL